MPDAHFETEIPVGERAHRTDIHDIRGKRVIEHAIVEKRDGRMIASVDDGQLIGLGELLPEAHTARALDAALTIENNVRSEDSFLAIVNFPDIEPARLPVGLH